MLKVSPRGRGEARMSAGLTCIVAKRPGCARVGHSAEKLLRLPVTDRPLAPGLLRRRRKTQVEVVGLVQFPRSCPVEVGQRHAAALPIAIDVVDVVALHPYH